MNINYKKEMERALASGVKLHTIRQKPIAVGTMLNHIVYPYHKDRRCVLSNYCKSTQLISIEPTSRTIIIDGKELSKTDMERLAKNDGFETMADFWSFFNQSYQGMIIHWTDTRY